MQKRYLAEFVGTFVLALGVVLSLSGDLFLPTPLLAALILMFFVYAIGWLSGCHINPAVTISLWTAKKIESKDAVMYMIAQVLAGLTVLALVITLGLDIVPTFGMTIPAFIFEMLGMMLFTFGIAMVVSGKSHDAVSGIVVGLSLLIGLAFSVLGGAAGILNPAVGIATQTWALGYYVAQIVGGILGVQLAAYLLLEDK